MILKDQLQRPLHIPKPPSRIVSLVPSQTELLVALGLEDQLVGITKFCVHPKHLRFRKTIVGGTKLVHYDKIAALEPDLILCNKEENTKDMVEALEKITKVHISDVRTIEDGVELVSLYGILFDLVERAAIIKEKILRAHETLQAYLNDKRDLRVVYCIWKNPWMVAANHTYIHSMLKAAKFVNCFESLSRYPTIELEQLDPEHLDVIMLSSEPYPFKKKHFHDLQNRFPNTKIILVDGEMFSWFGSRMRLAFNYFIDLREDLSSQSF